MAAVASAGEHFAWFCSTQVEQSIDRFAGTPLELEGWQREIFDEALSVGADGRPIWSSVAIVLPRKNGKTTLLAAYALYRLIYDDGQPEILLAAASDKQAGRLFDAVCSFVRRSPALMEFLTIRAYVGEIARKDGEGKILRMSSSPERLHGYNPSLVICDEVAQWTTPNLKKAWAALTTGGGARSRTQTFTISTAGMASQRSDSILGRMIDGNESLGVVERDGALAISRNEAAQTLVYNFSAQTTDPFDTPAVKAANPASWITPEYLARQAANPEVSKSDFLQLHACVWADGEDQWITAEAVALAGREGERIAEGEQVALGFDGAMFDDSTALFACRLDDGFLALLDVWEKPQGAMGWQVPRGEVDAAVHRAMATFQVRRAYLDPPYWQSEIEKWSLEFGVEVVIPWYTARDTQMGAALERFRTDMLDGKFHHDASAVFMRHLLNARMSKTRSGYRIGKPEKGGGKIDAAVAAVLAYEARCDAVADGALRPKRSGRAIFV